MKKRIRALSGSLLTLTLFFGYLTSCGTKNCSILDQALHEPSCKNLNLSIAVRPVAPANCAGAPNSRNLTISCPASAGTTMSCTSISDGFTVVVVLVPNNAGGNFKDTNGTGTTYTSCNQLWTDVQLNLVAGILGIYTSDNSAGNRLNCDDVNGCRLTNSQGCFSGWDGVNMLASGTASIPAGTNALACAYIDNAPLSATTIPASYNTWINPLVAFNNITGTLNFSNSSPSSWTDAW